MPQTPTERLNLRIAELVTRAQPEEIVDILTGPEPALLSRTNQNQNQNQNRRAQAAAAAEE